MILSAIVSLIFSLTWCLPQTLLGFILVILTGSVYTKRVGAWAYLFTMPTAGLFSWLSGFSLGPFICLHKINSDNNTVNHENGHCMQGMFFGPLYLLAIGLPSVIRNIRARFLIKKMTYKELDKWYYSAYPENWADKLGGVRRS